MSFFPSSSSSFFIFLLLFVCPHNNNINNRITGEASLTNAQKSAIAQHLGKVDQCLNEGADEFLQLFDLCAFIMRTCPPAS